MSIYSVEADAFNNGELQLLTELADSLSFGIISLRRKEALRESEDRYRQLVQTQSDLICRSLADTTITFANESLCRVLGCSLEELKGKKWLEFAVPDDLQSILERISQLTPEKPSFLSEHRYDRANGQIGWTQWINQGIFNVQGELIEIQSVGRDITELKQVESALRESEERYRLLAENINDLVCIHQLDGKYLYVSLSCESLLGYTYDEMMRTDPYTLWHPEDRHRIIQDNIASVQTIKPIPITYRMRHKSGDYIWFETLTKPILDSNGQVVRLQTTSRDVTERILAQNQLKYEALHDTLTGLPNRLLLMERLELAINRFNRSENYHFAVLFLDLDRFKVINDSLGHLTGDQLLIIIAQKLQSMIRTTDLAARLGGDEFVILLDDIKDIQDCIRVTERIFTELADPLIIDTREIYINTSIGIVFGSKDYQDATQLLRDADIAMYRAKNQGKARYEIFNAQMHTEAITRLHLENDLRQALAKLDADKTPPEFVLYYQPIIDLDTEQLAGFEALIRWIHPTKGLIPPGEFIPIAEETGLITLLDYWVLRTACEQLSAWQKILPHTSHLKVSVNLTAQDLQQKNLLEVVDRVLYETNLPCCCLILEITESMLIDDIEHTITVLENLKKCGIKISIDDFGTGYSSLSYLHRLPVDNLKVDRSFVNQMQEHQRNDQIIKTIITLSKHLELKAIAEGIETREQLERLQQLKYQ
ncbi:MAG TPA: EAL domain-containing protein, partial [Allocoleopsis sp.]